MVEYKMLREKERTRRQKETKKKSHDEDGVFIEKNIERSCQNPSSGLAFLGFEN